MTCFPCNHPSQEPYDYNAMGMFFHWGQLCDPCIEKFKAMKPPTQKYILNPVKKATEFVPKEVKLKRDYTEREPGEDG